LKILKQRWLSPRITFGFTNCPTCKENKIDAPHLPILNSVIVEISSFEKEVREKAKQRIKFEGMHNDAPLKDPSSPYFQNEEAYAMFKLAYYQCFKCKNAYFGGKKDCIRAQQEEQVFKPEELVCASCSAVGVAGTQDCKSHGKDFIEFKCRFCCSIAQWFCWGTTHFCDPCHKR
jgi:E3 ubiquitin-protein ligase MYCBP2